MKKILIIASAAILLSSCAEEFLSKKPLDTLSEEAVFNSAALAESFINSAYSVLPDPFQEGNISSITDEGFFRYGGTSTRYIASGQMTPSNVMYMDEGGQAHNTRTTTLNIWNRAYEVIYNLNYFITYVNDKGSAIEEDAKTTLLGEAYCLRAWAYYNLIQRYAGVPIIKEPHNLSSDFGVQRAKFDDCVDFIYEDLELAEDLLPAKEECRLGRVNMDVALAIRARTALLAASKFFNNPTGPEGEGRNPEGDIFYGKYDYDAK
ncbi:MAG: RagB/SusD family nutrient uptake outer membrane protein [Bacteroidales bacterium]|nr:RagB/SusD family nutrient uptake outer membrane protein [Bacteroidales bacterium]